MLRFFFFFQAEDGIRDLVRSRGLGDVYKRQGYDLPDIGDFLDAFEGATRHWCCAVTMDRAPSGGFVDPVSYTHLTLPTSDLV